MPFELIRHPGYFLARLTGAIGPDDLAQLAQRADEIDDSLPEPVDYIADLTGVEAFNVDFRAVSDLATRRRERRYDRVVHAALVADRPVAVGFARMYQTILNHPEVEVRIFGTMEEALAWLAPPAT